MSAHTCTWTQDDDGVWWTACGNAFEITNLEGPHGNEMRYCAFCGKPLVEDSYADECADSCADECTWETITTTPLVTWHTSCGMDIHEPYATAICPCCAKPVRIIPEAIGPRPAEENR